VLPNVFILVEVTKKSRILSREAESEYKDEELFPRDAAPSVLNSLHWSRNIPRTFTMHAT